MGRKHSRLQDLMRLDTVNRWGIVEVMRPQSVAEHQYRVAVLALEFIQRFRMQQEAAADLLRVALTHDGPEARTGDLDGHFKRTLIGIVDSVEGEISGDGLLDYVEKNLCPWIKDEPHSDPTGAERIVKFLDKLETYCYLRRWGVDPDTETYLREIWATVEQRSQVVDEVIGLTLQDWTTLHWANAIVDEMPAAICSSFNLSMLDVAIRVRPPRPTVAPMPAPTSAVKVTGKAAQVKSQLRMKTDT